MSELKTNTIATNDGNNVAIDNALRLKNYTTTQRDALTSAAGDIIYNSTDSEVQAYDGSSWVSLGAITQGASISIDYLVVGGGGGACRHDTRGTGGGGAGGTVNSYNYGSEGTGGRYPRAQSTLSLYKNLRYNVSIGAGGARQNSSNTQGFNGLSSYFHTVSAIGGGATTLSSAVDFASAGPSATSRFMIPPKITTTQRGNLTGVVSGAIIYNTSTNKLQVFNGSTWVNLH